MDWFQQNMGLIVLGAFVLLGVLGYFARRAARRYQNRLIAEGSNKVHEPKAPNGKIAKESRLSTVISFSASRERVLAALADHRVSGGWKALEEGLWQLRVGGKVDGKPATVAELQAAGRDVAQLVLLSSGDIGGVPTVGRSWQELCAQLSAVIVAKGIHSAELDGPELVRTAVGDTTGMTPMQESLHPRVWLRPGHTF